MLKSSSGLELEKECSVEFHSGSIPLLISPKLLRARMLGQVDLACLKKDQQGWIVEVAEVKSSQVGIQQMEGSQKKRLYSSVQFLASLLGHRTRLVRLLKRQQLDQSF